MKNKEPDYKDMAWNDFANHSKYMGEYLNSKYFVKGKKKYEVNNDHDILNDIPPSV